MNNLSEKQFSFLEKTVKLIDKYGIIKILKAIIVLTTFTYITLNISNLDKIIESAIVANDNEKINEHDKALEYRRSIKPEIDLILNNILTTLNADRAFILELHNGTNNTAGLPFIYAEMTYSDVSEGISHIDEDYINLNLSRFQFPMYLSKEEVWNGDMKQLSKIDSKLANRLMSNDVEYFCIITLHGANCEIGYFGVTYCSDFRPEREELLRKIAISSQKISSLLSKK